MKTFLIIFQIAVSVLLVVSILSQEKGTGLSGTFGGGGQFFRGRRGVDRVLMWVTVVLAILFVSTSLSFLFLQTPRQSPDVSVSSVTTEPAK